MSLHGKYLEDGRDKNNVILWDFSVTNFAIKVYDSMNTSLIIRRLSEGSNCLCF